MRTPAMDQNSSQNHPAAGLQPVAQDGSHAQRRRSSSIRDQTSEMETYRSRASSVAQSDNNSESSRYNRARGPINDAVHSALDPIDPNHATISPEIINQITSQITANVLQQLKASQLSPPLVYSSPSTDDQMDPTSPTGASPHIDRDRAASPPSPFRASEVAAHMSPPTSPRKQFKFPSVSEPRRPPTPPFSHGTLSEDSDAKEGKLQRPKSERTSTGGEGTILEKIWGQLFDEYNQPTTKLRQFLRGTAVHLIEDYEPKHSLVVTPDKMLKYYEETKLSHEIYPWQTVFDDRTSSISRMFRELEAQHHLVQDRLYERPDIPGLTPVGFEAWMTLMLKAHPDEEFERLAYTALHMPVSNPDDRRERFPKELSRRQFPAHPDLSIASKIEKVLQTHCGVRGAVHRDSISDKDNKPNPPSAKPQKPPPPIQTNSQRPVVQTDYSLSQSTTRSSIPEVDRNSLRHTVSEIAVEDSPIEIVPPPLERERKPYVAQPGGGKTYENFEPAPYQQVADSRSAQPMSQTSAKLTRSTSLNNGRPVEPKMRPQQPVSVHQRGPPTDAPPPTRQRTNSIYHKDTPRRHDRNRSPSISRTNEPANRSDADMAYGVYHSSTSDHPTNTRRENRYDQRGSYPVEPRPRYNSLSSNDSQRYYPKDVPNDEEYYRSSNSGYPRPEGSYHSQQQCPPNSFRSRA